MPKEFETKRVLVTGAASGIGKAQAIAFAEQGAEVIGIDLDETGLKQTAALVKQILLSHLLILSVMCLLPHLCKPR